MKKNIIVIFLIVLFPLAFLLVFGKALTHKFNTLPFYHPTEIFLDSVDNVRGKAYQIPPFRFKNYNGDTVSRDGEEDAVYLLIPLSLESKYLAAVTEKLLSINFNYRDEHNIKIYCLDVNSPDTDPDLALDYMNNINSNFDNSKNYYVLSSHSKSVMLNFVKNGLGINQVEDSPYALLIDPNGQIRGRYHLQIESHVVDAKDDIALLRKEISLGKYNEKKKLEQNN